MDSSFSSPRIDAFPAGLRVLVVDDDLVWLRILEKMLKKCSYEVTTCCLAREALDLLRERKDGFDIVISDVNMPDMDGFKLLEYVGLEMDLPVIMMSVDGETSRVMRGVQHGACDYLLKPIRMKELRNIWQHVLRKRIHEVRDIEGFDEFQMTRSDTGKKRKDPDNKHDEREGGDSSSVKKTRVIWTVDLHQKFVTAVNQIGLHSDDFHRCLAEVGPKKILDLMNVPRLTRENVASHLQKYRLYLSRIQNGNERKGSFDAIKQSDLSSNDLDGSVSLRSSVKLQKNKGNKTLVHNTGERFHDNDLKNIIKKTVVGDISDIPKTSSSKIAPTRTFKQLVSNIKYGPFDQTISETYFGNDIPKIQFNKENVINRWASEPISSSTSLSVNNQLILHDLGLGPERLLSEICPDVTSRNGDLFSCLIQGEQNYITHLEQQNIECFNPNIPELFAETAVYSYDPQRLDYEYHVMDQGLFII